MIAYADRPAQQQITLLSVVIMLSLTQCPLSRFLESSSLVISKFNLRNASAVQLICYPQTGKTAPLVKHRVAMRPELPGHVI